jgi:HrpA-like RNA helicase
MQRAGRAGREGPGLCFRLYTEDAFNSMVVSAEPEVQRTSLTSAFLQLKVIGQDLDAMPFMDKPDQESGMFRSYDKSETPFDALN